MGEALLSGLVASGWADFSELAVAERLPVRRAELSELYPEVLVDERPYHRVDAVLAVKPNDVSDALADMKSRDVSRVLSVAAGVPLSTLEAGLPAGARVLRSMPNTPALLGFGAAALAKGGSADEADASWGVEILSSVGLVEVVEEAQLDAVTGLSGSGPAYVFLLAEALIAAGVAVGLPSEVADVLVRQTIRGASEMLVALDRLPADLRADVTSPGGTTAAGIAVLEQEGFQTAIKEAVETAALRSAELGRVFRG